MSSSAPFLLSASEQYDGTNWLEFKTKIRAAAKQRGVLGYLDGTIPCPLSPAEEAAATALLAKAQGTTKATSTPSSSPTPSPTTFATAYWGSLTPTYDKWHQRDAWTQGLISLNLKNAIGLGIKLDGTAAESYTSIANIKDAVSDLGCITAEAELNVIRYSDGSDMDEHVAALRTAWMKANGQGAGITETKFRMVVLKSLPPTWLPFIRSLYAETTSAGVIARVSAHSKMIISLIPVLGTSLKALSTSAGNSKLRNCDVGISYLVTYPETSSSYITTTTSSVPPSPRTSAPSHPAARTALQPSASSHPAARTSVTGPEAWAALLMLPLPVSAPQGFALGCTQDFPTLHLDPADAVALTRSVTMVGALRILP
ncbi:hypothetical protein D9619_008907 [Psilocybe cf. subviscida]|uniref:Uncharacterized protein n=1 Tax=Psilocybe cf. subviscida TaxID=2480587 RepID=A0A8H5BA99_9AGAR|nr:hypothetical protein D9619_008907 [Psilocybe cf. subviscida]